ncbi:hypothetical protein BASA81_001246 [Batrachochytrium salamandrivorans]|nr:hypothetical protein BASA81_001246 [Batrachochytrium salamandrivorans]
MALRARDDRESGGFIYHSVVVRLAKIVRGVTGFEDVASALEDASFAIFPLSSTDGGPAWDQYVERELEDTLTGNCLDVGWFFLENYMYRLVLGRVGYFTPGSSGYLLDPWRKSKEEALLSALADFNQLCLEHPTPTFREAVLCSLWGNRNDLSLSAGVVEGNHSAGQLLVDDVAAVAGVVKNKKNRLDQQRVAIVLDNCGAELLADLRLASQLLDSDVAEVVLHCKAHPVFVSDALESDVHWHIAALKDTAMGLTLAQHVANKRLLVVSHEFYCSPVEYSRAPAQVKSWYEEASLVIVKGDANYRRLFGDRPLPCDFPFVQVARRITSTPLLAIRTCKSPVIVGITQRQFLEETNRDKDWRNNGTVGIIQFA